MKTEHDIRQTLRRWIVNTNGRIAADEFTDQTPILEQRIIKSVHVMELVVLVEQLRGRPIDVERLKPRAFRDLDAIYSTFFADVTHGARADARSPGDS